METNKSKPGSVLLVATALSLLMSSCAANIEDTAAFTGTLESSKTKDPTKIEIMVPSTAIEKQPVILDKKCNDLQSFGDYLSSFKTMDNPRQVLINPEKYTKDELILAAYLNLKNCGLSLEDVEEELSNILVYSQYPTCLSEEAFEALVGTLHRTLGYIANPFSSYHPLSQAVHELSCDKLHTEEYGIYTCDDLKLAAEDIRPLSLEEYLDKNIGDNVSYQRIKAALELHPEHHLEDYLNELNKLIIFQLNPADLPDEVKNAHLGKLNATLGEYESLYGTYIDLAVYIYNLMNPDAQLEKNDLGIYTTRKLVEGKTN